MIEAQCEGCGKSWKVPEAGRAYECRECGGKVAAGVAEVPAPASAPAGVSCWRCQTSNASDAQFCERCGTRLGRRKRPGVSGGPVERNMMLREFGRVRQIVSTLRMLYVLGAVLVGVYLLTWITIGMTEGGMSSGIYLAILGVLVGLLALQVVGAVRVAREPLLWSVVIAGFATLGLAIYLTNDSIRPLPLVMRSLWVLVLWGGVATASRLPEVGDPRVEEGGTGRGAAIFPLPKGELRTRWKLEERLWVLDGITFPEVEAGPADETLQRFTEAWNAGSLEDIVGFFAAESQDKQRETLERIFGRRDWIASRPKIEESDLKMRSPGRARAYHLIGDDELRSDWEWQHPRWVLVGLKLPRR